MKKEEVKQLFFDRGAELCGIASIDRFSDAPKGFHPTDVLPACKSVISFAMRFPSGCLSCKTDVPYTQIRNTITPKMDMIAFECCLELEKRGVLAVPIPTNDSRFDNTTGRLRSIVSQKHAAQAAGLGTIGRHSLLITSELGSMVWLGCVLTEAELEPDELKPNICNDCCLCVSACPINAIESPEMHQQACWDHAFGDHEGTWQIHCHRCRDICPHNFGKWNSGMKR